MKYIAITIGLVAGNYIYAYFTDKNYEKARERSIFQWMAVFICYLSDY